MNLGSMLEPAWHSSYGTDSGSDDNSEPPALVMFEPGTDSDSDDRYTYSPSSSIAYK